MMDLSECGRKTVPESGYTEADVADLVKETAT